MDVASGYALTAQSLVWAYGALSVPPGTAITRVLPPVSRFSPDAGHSEKKQRVIERLTDFFDRFFGLGPLEGSD